MSTNHNHSDNATKFVANDERMHWHDQALWFVREKRDRASKSIKPRTTTTPKQTPEVNTKHYYKPNMKFIPKNLYWLWTNTAYPLIIPNENYILRKEATSYPDESAPDLLEYYVVYRPLSELITDTEYAAYMGFTIDTEHPEYNELFKSYTFDGETISDIINTIANNLLGDLPITDAYKKYINSIESFKEAVFTGLIKL